MAIFLIDYAKLLIKRFPDGAKELSALSEKMVQKDDVQKGQWGYCNLRELTIRKNNKYNEGYPAYRLLLCRALDLLENNKEWVPLLSTPTHTPMYIDPLVLIQKLKQYQQANVEPDDIDMQIALSRLAFDHTSQMIHGKVKEWTSPTLSMELPEGENVRIIYRVP